MSYERDDLNCTLVENMLFIEQKIGAPSWIISVISKTPFKKHTTICYRFEELIEYEAKNFVVI